MSGHDDPFQPGDMVRLTDRIGWWTITEVYTSGHLRVVQEATGLFDTVDSEDVTEFRGVQR